MSDARKVHFIVQMHRVRLNFSLICDATGSRLRYFHQFSPFRKDHKRARAQLRSRRSIDPQIIFTAASLSDQRVSGRKGGGGGEQPQVFTMALGR